MTTLLNIDRRRLRDHFAARRCRLRTSCRPPAAHGRGDRRSSPSALPDGPGRAQLRRRPRGRCADGEAPRASLRPARSRATIETNGCWMVLKNIERDPEYKRCSTRCLDEVDARSSPTARAG